jgi:hypothetical protein
MRKAELSINVIIVAAIALLVLVIVSVIFMARMGIFNKTQSDCLAVNGQCTYGDTCQEGTIKHPSAVCYGADSKKDPYRVCCIMQTST